MTDSIYANLKPSIFKKGHYPDADMALFAYMRDILFIFIEKECDNGEVEYHPGGSLAISTGNLRKFRLSNILYSEFEEKDESKKGKWDDFFDGKGNPEFPEVREIAQIIPEGEVGATYRGIGRAHLEIDNEFKELIDLYWFFKVELRKLGDIITDDWFKAHGRPFSKEEGPFIRHEVGANGIRKVVFNKKGKIPGYKMKFSYRGTPDGFIHSIEVDKFKRLLDLSNIMWI